MLNRLESPKSSGKPGPLKEAKSEKEIKPSSLPSKSLSANKLKDAKASKSNPQVKENKSKPKN
jgi:hypothetical protein